MNVFTNYTMQISIPTSLNGNTFSYLHGFGMMCDFNTTYYVIDWSGNRIFVLNDNYGYVTQKTFSAPTYMIIVNSNLYISGQNNIWETDKYLNTLNTYTFSGAGYRGIYFNLTDNSIYAAPIGYTYFQLFDLNLTLNYTVNVSPKSPYAISEYNNEL